MEDPVPGLFNMFLFHICLCNHHPQGGAIPHFCMRKIELAGGIEAFLELHVQSV